MQSARCEHFAANQVELAAVLSIKTGGCPEDCGYCPQSVRYDTGVGAAKLIDVATVAAADRTAKEHGATRFCMGAAWRVPKDRDIEAVWALQREVRSPGLEAYCTPGMLSVQKVASFKDAGLDCYNHNLDAAPEAYGRIISARDYQVRLNTLSGVRNAGISVCSGGIVGTGESRCERAGPAAQSANLDPYPESVPINELVRVEGTPLAEEKPLDPLEFVRTIAVARITMPLARVRLSAGRQQMSEAVQALCFLAGANSVFYGEKLLTTGNPDVEKDRALFAKLGVTTAASQHIG